MAGATINFVRDKFGRDVVSYSYSIDGSSEQKIRADVNQDGNIDASDFMLVIRRVLGFSTLTWQSSTTTGDANCDGEVTIQDSLLILKKTLGFSMSDTIWCE